MQQGALSACVPVVELVGQAGSADAVFEPAPEALRLLELVDEWPPRFSLVNTYLRRRLPDRRLHGGVYPLPAGKQSAPSTADALVRQSPSISDARHAPCASMDRALHLRRGPVHQRLLSDEREPTLTQIAAQYSYADETHLIRD